MARLFESPPLSTRVSLLSQVSLWWLAFLWSSQLSQLSFLSSRFLCRLRSQISVFIRVTYKFNVKKKEGGNYFFVFFVEFSLEVFDCFTFRRDNRVVCFNEEKFFLFFLKLAFHWSYLNEFLWFSCLEFQKRFVEKCVFSVVGIVFLFDFFNECITFVTYFSLFKFKFEKSVFRVSEIRWDFLIFCFFDRRYF